MLSSSMRCAGESSNVGMFLHGHSASADWIAEEQRIQKIATE